MAIREKLLLPELQNQHRSSSFVDRRFGEGDQTITEEEKMVQRFARERLQRARSAGNRKSIFNLNDNDCHDFELTHLGRKVDDIEEFSDNAEEETGPIDGPTVRLTHFGGPKTKSEVMKEVIAKSKFHRAERQKVREENTDLCTQLDKDFDTLRDTLFRSDRRGEPKATDPFDESVRQMTFDRRVQPSDRTKTADELVKARRDAESQARARMAETDVVYDNARSEAAAAGDAALAALVAEFCRESSPDAYAKLVDHAKGRNAIQLGRVLRLRTSRLAKAMGKKKRLGMPGRPSLMLFHLIRCIFSTSDFHHVVCTPALIVMAGYLQVGQIKTPRHAISGIILCRVLCSWQSESKRLVPEIFTFISRLLHFLLRRAGTANLDCGGEEAFSMQTLFANMRGPTFDEKTLAFCLGALASVVKETAQVYSTLASFPELLLPIKAGLEKKTLFFGKTIAHLETLLGQTRQPLTLQHHRPVPLPQLTPKLDSDSFHNKNHADHQRLKAAYKRELRGARRELLRDSAFIANQQQSERKKKDEEYTRLINRIHGIIGNDQANALK